jgi:lipopolysaccharide export system permease protein
LYHITLAAVKCTGRGILKGQKNMPILWRYLLRNYFQVFALCVLSFISILLVIRFQEIARFASSGARASTVFLFALYQIPFLLPIAIPISCLIAAILLFKKMSHSHELTALRACGLGLKPLFLPLVIASFFLSLLNFTIISELSPLCRSLSKKMVYHVTSANPLFLLQKETMVKLKNAYIDMKALRDKGKRAEDVIFIINNPSHGRLGLMTAKELFLDKDLLIGERVTLISNIDTKNSEGFDHLVIESQSSMSTKAATLSQFLQTPEWVGKDDYLSLRMLLAKEKILRKTSSFFGSRSYQEITRRFTLGFAAFTFTFLGTAFGMEISRSRSKKGLAFAIALSAMFMVCFISAKSFKHSPMLATFIYLAPHPIILFFSFRFLKKISRGIE